MEIEKSILAVGPEDNSNLPSNLRVNQKRGITVLSSRSLMGQSATLKDGQVVTAEFQLPYFTLTVAERLDIFRFCGPVFGVITSRMNRVASLEWKVTKQSREEDRIIEKIRSMRDLVQEYEDDKSSKAVGIRLRAMAHIFRYLPDVRMDLKNFDASLLRWSRKNKAITEDKCSEIENWLKSPNQGQTFENLTKSIVFDTHVHGIAVPFKEVQNKLIENIYCLPGGTVYPIRGRNIGDPVSYVQVVDGFDPQLFFQDEVSCLQYAPHSDDPYGGIPLESLVNKVAESLMFDARAAEMADGTKPPEKLLAFGDRTPFGSLEEQFEMPMDKDEQKRIETVVNEARKEALRVITGHGTPVVVDVSRADTFQYQSERQRMVREEVGLVFGASNTEMNLSGSDSTSGRSTSETQERYDLYKGVFPMMQSLENFWNQDILPFRFGSGYEFTYEPSLSESVRVKLLKDKLESGLYTANELRIEDMGRDPFRGEEYSLPRGAQPPQPPQPDPNMMGMMQ